MPRTHSRSLAGRRFGRLLVVEETSDRAGNQAIVWLCRCQCGVEVHVSTSNLTSGNTQSCGCWQREISRAANAGRRR